MQKILKLSKEQARVLYTLLSSHSAANRSDNRKRFQFLDVIEDFVFKYEDQVNALKKNPTEADITSLTEVSKEVGEFTFTDREVFAKVKDMFEKCYETGTKSQGQMGKTVSSPLVGRNAKIYVEIEDAFIDVKEIKEGPK